MAQKRTSFFQKDRVFSLVQVPEFVDSFPRLEMDVPYGLTMRVVYAKTCVLDFSLVAPLARIGVDVMHAVVADGSLFGHGSILGHVRVLRIAVPGDVLRSVAVMEVKIEDGSMRETVSLSGVFDTNMNVVDPAEARGKVGGTMMTRRANCDKGSSRCCRNIGKDCINSVANSSNGALESIQRFTTKIQVAFMQGRLLNLSIGAVRLDWSGYFFQMEFQIGSSRVAHSFQFLHPSLAMYSCDSRGQDAYGA